MSSHTKKHACKVSTAGSLHQYLSWVNSGLGYTIFDNPLLIADLLSAEFKPEQWFKAAADAWKDNPEGGSKKKLGAVFRNLGVHGYNTSSDYQQTLGNFGPALFKRIQRKLRPKFRFYTILMGLSEVGKLFWFLFA